MLGKLKQFYRIARATITAVWWQHNHGDEAMTLAEEFYECEQCGGQRQDFHPDEMCDEHRERLDELTDSLSFP